MSPPKACENGKNPLFPEMKRGLYAIFKPSKSPPQPGPGSVVVVLGGFYFPPSTLHFYSYRDGQRGGQRPWNLSSPKLCLSPSCPGRPAYKSSPKVARMKTFG
jgi:hypothetical protein